MSKKKKTLANGRSGGETRHVRLHHWLLKSDAYRSLSVGARSLLVELYVLYNGSNNGGLYLSARVAGERLGVSKAQAARWFHELEAIGFIRARQRGAFTLKARHATTWILCEFEFAGQLPTKSFMRFKAPETQKPVSLVTPYGLTHETKGAFQGDKRGKNAPTVSPTLPSEPKCTASRYLPRDTVSLPGRGDFLTGDFQGKREPEMSEKERTATLRP